MKSFPQINIELNTKNEAELKLIPLLFNEARRHGVRRLKSE